MNDDQNERFAQHMNEATRDVPFWGEGTWTAVPPTNDDAEVLRQAALILRRRSTKPKSIMLRTLLNVLRDTADNIDAAEDAKRP